MNPNFNWTIVAERMQAIQAEADAAARARWLRRSRRGRAFAPAGPGRRHQAVMARGIMRKAVEAL